MKHEIMLRQFAKHEHNYIVFIGANIYETSIGVYEQYEIIRCVY